MKHLNRGASTGAMLVFALFAFASLVWVLSDFVPADAADVQAVAQSASESAAAKAELKAMLQATPNPDRQDLRRMRAKVNEILVTETVRTVTGDQTIESPAQRERREHSEQEEMARRIKQASWSELSFSESATRVTLIILDAAPYVLYAAFMFFGAFLGWRAIFRPRY